jgi:hypothetical protein
MIYWTINCDEGSVFHTRGYVATPAKALLNCALAQIDDPMEKFFKEITRRNVVKVAVVRDPGAGRPLAPPTRLK